MKPFRIILQRSSGDSHGRQIRENPSAEQLSGSEIGYSIVNVSDYNHDGLADLVWSNGSSLYLWTNTNTSDSSTASFTSTKLVAPASGMTVFNNNVH